MSAPYVSIKRLVDNSLAAMLAAVEVYNKSQMTYRDEVAVMLVVNAWELALKATLRQQRQSRDADRSSRCAHRGGLMEVSGGLVRAVVIKSSAVLKPPEIDAEWLRASADRGSVDC
ncbi:hypothetical protein R3P93_22600 [Rhodococcus cerastii]|uniref:DUF3644 domain-containing protein n=1 Tax=Rhodococcus cerastii TaxID=908616 RepID=A0ABU4D6K8_9NOCA|nr:DUF3644 domain-containing protein [Rhodococcus cerastii]MDV6305364.1 hypothetical protein [Rhodococcus cerastii]